MTPVDPFTGVPKKRAVMEPLRIHPAVPKTQTARQKADLEEAEYEARRLADARAIWGTDWCGD